jgi:hypothetical protein
MENNLTHSELLQEDGHWEDLPFYQDVDDVFDALREFTGYDDFMLSGNTLSYGDDFEKVLTDKEWVSASELTEFNTISFYQIAMEWCHQGSPSWQDLPEY